MHNIIQTVREMRRLRRTDLNCREGANHKNLLEEGAWLRGCLIEAKSIFEEIK